VCTVEKYIGDAVMALFGAPVAHEDDPERAVRAGLAIREALVEEGDLQVRVGITTGEALVSLGARPSAGEGMASGDVVNTAARLQSAAPVDGILVDEPTYRASERVIAYRERRPVEAKGKADPVPAWEALEAKARFGVDVRQVSRTPLVGREDDIDALVATLARARRDREPQLVTIVGVPGIGKTRLLWELFQRVGAGPELTFWRQGRSLPYGEGISFWALAEVVKAQAGVLETDDRERTEAKLRETVAALAADAAEAQWLERHLRPLVGLEVATDSGGDRRGEAFAAWRRFLEALAEQRPLVLVFEDLHFADDGLLDFVDHLVDWASGVPMLVVATARPELLARRAGWGGGKPNAQTISLAPLSDEQTARLVHSLLGRPVLDVELQERLVGRAGGNPLYAEEFARMHEERGWSDEPTLPETVQGLIAARIDGLVPDEKRLLQDVSVVGKVFWLGSAVSLAGAGAERWAAEETLHALERKEFVRRERRSSVAGEVEYAFRHLLVRDVAYGQIPRAARADRHRAAAEWIESLGRPEDHAEMLAHHYLSAIELSRAAGGAVTELGDAARGALREAGDRALALNAFPAAARYYAEALALWPARDAERAELLFRLARARHVAGHELREQTLEEAREALLEVGRFERAAEVESLLAEVWWYRGNRDRADVHLDRARTMVEELPPSAAKAHVLSQVARYRALAGDDDVAVRLGHEALAMAEMLGLDELRAHALNNIGIARVHMGDFAGIADVELASELALAMRSPEGARALNNLAATALQAGDFRRAQHYYDEAIRVGEELGLVSMTGFVRAMRIVMLVRVGVWEEALRRANDYVAARGADEPSQGEIGVRRFRARILLGRGDVDAAVADLRQVLASAREAKDPQMVTPALGYGARTMAALGRVEEAQALAAELLGQPKYARDWRIVELAWVARRLGCADEVRLSLEQATLHPRWIRVIEALIEERYEDAAEGFAEIGDLDSEAEARLRAAEQLVAQGRRPEANAHLDQALAFFRSAGASRFVQQAERLLAATA